MSFVPRKLKFLAVFCIMPSIDYYTRHHTDEKLLFVFAANKYPAKLSLRYKWAEDERNLYMYFMVHEVFTDEFIFQNSSCHILTCNEPVFMTYT